MRFPRSLGNLDRGAGRAFSIGVVLLTSAIIGYFLTLPTKIKRILLFAASLLLIHPEKTTDFIGLGLLVFVLQRRRRPQATPVP